MADQTHNLGLLDYDALTNWPGLQTNFKQTVDMVSLAKEVNK